MSRFCNSLKGESCKRKICGKPAPTTLTAPRTGFFHALCQSYLHLGKNKHHELPMPHQEQLHNSQDNL